MPAHLDIANESALSRPRIGREPAAIYRHGLMIRESEKLLLDLFTQGLLSGTTHTCLGQELCQMSVVRALDHAEDAVLSNHRNHGHFLTYSGNFLGLIAEIMGRRDGVCGGIGGSQHLAYGHFHSNGVQAGMTALGVGLAWARKQRGAGMVATIVGDGTLGEGLLYESMNLASIWRLPLLFVLENNGIAQTTLTAETVGGSLEERGRAFGLSTWRLDDAAPDFLEQVEAVTRQVRAGHPGLLIIDTRRLGPHSKGDDLRDPAELALIQLRDPLARAGAGLPAELRARVEEEVRAAVDEVRRQAEASPEASALIAETTILRPAETHPLAWTRPAGNVRSLLNAALDGLLAADSRVVLLGEDLHEPYGGAFKVTQGLSDKYAGRVISTPISEAGITGAGIGLALAGFRPVVEIMFADFVTLAMDQLYNHAVKFPGMFPGTTVPLVVRTPSGGRRGYGPTHSQSPESLMAAVPGLTVVYPSHRHDAGLALQNAVLRWPNPTVFFEHKLLYGETSALGGYEILPDGGDAGLALFPTLRRPAPDGGPGDLTIVAYGGMLPLVEKFAAELATEDVEVEIVSPSLLSPLPKENLVGHLAGRRRVAVMEETYGGASLGMALGAALLEAGWPGKFRRLHCPPVPIPAARSLEAQILPGQRHMMAAIIDLLLS